MLLLRMFLLLLQLIEFYTAIHHILLLLRNDSTYWVCHSLLMALPVILPIDIQYCDHLIELSFTADLLLQYTTTKEILNVDRSTQQREDELEAARSCG